MTGPPRSVVNASEPSGGGPTLPAELLSTLQRMFGFSSLRAGQLEVILAAADGRDVLAVMPTGAGKSLTYQLPAVAGWAAGESGLTLVVSPLIALMRDQVERLRQRGLPAAVLNSSVPASEQEVTLAGLERLCLLYCAPERLRQPDTLRALLRVGVRRLVVDEAHCVSHWGHDFRPDYRDLGQARRKLGSPPVTAVTATATPRVQQDIIASLDMNAVVRVRTGFDRPNLRYSVYSLPKASAKRAAFVSLALTLPTPGIVYVGTRREAEDLSAELQARGVRSSFYHGARDAREREAVQDAFMGGRLEVVVATNAFGMGLDKRNVRFVLHYRLPASVEAYAQEAGRAGRDGQPAECVLLVAPEDRGLQDFFIHNSTPSLYDLRRTLAYLRAGVQARTGRASFRAWVVARSLGVSAGKLRATLDELEELGALERRGDTPDALDLSFGEAVEWSAVNVEARKAQRSALLDEMLAYTQHGVCRRRFILAYFGQAVAEENCGACDACRETLAPWERAALLGVRDAGPVNWDLTVRQLCGSLSARAASGAANPQAAALAGWTQPDVAALLELLGQRGYLVGARAIPALTPRGEGLVNRPPEVAPAPQPPSTLGACLELHRNGETPELIARALGLPLAGVERRLLQAVQEGALRPRDVVSPEVSDRVHSLAARVGYSPLAALRSGLPGVSDLEIRVTQWMDDQGS